MMSDQEIEKLIKDIEEGKGINFNDQFKMLATIYKKMKQLYQQTYNPPTNNDLNKSINDLSSRISILESKIK
jgi:aromatic ring-opening dioxygenase catalytic subunit (LigB family)|tara:strand:+ start:69 stop:284 length:216 start_codon:yes stop_codon:yes gene_type:complete